jgi:IS5 family transposase
MRRLKYRELLGNGRMRPAALIQDRLVISARTQNTIIKLPSFRRAGGWRPSSLDALAALIDWSHADQVWRSITPPQKARKAWPPLAMFKALLLATWHDRSDVALSEALSDRASFRRFCGFARDKETPERTAFVRLRRELVAHGLDRSLFAAIARDLNAKGACVRKGTLTDATVIGSASKGDKEASWAKHRTRAPAHGYKAHIAADKDNGLIREVEATPANEADVTIAPAIIPDGPGEVHADRAYDALWVERAIKAKGGTSRLMRKGHRWLPAARCGGAQSPAASDPRKDREHLRHLETQLPLPPYAVDRACQSQTASPSRRHRLQPQTLLADANGVSRPVKRTGNVDQQDRSPQRPLARRHRTAQSAISTLSDCLPNHTRRLKAIPPNQGPPRAPVSKHFCPIDARKYSWPLTPVALRRVEFMKKV